MINYDEIYRKNWNSHAEIVGPRKRIILKMISEVHGKIIDIGCGTGDFIRELKKLGISAVGIETSDEAIKIATKNKLNVKKRDFLNTKYDSNTFSTVTLIDVLEHIKEDKKAIDEAQRILKKNGLLIISVPYKQSLWGKDDESVGHYRRYERKDFEKLLFKNFKIEEIKYSGFPFYIIIRKIKLKIQKKDGLTTGCFVKSYSKKNKIFAWIIELMTRIELIFQKFPYGTSIIVKARKL